MDEQFIQTFLHTVGCGFLVNQTIQLIYSVANNNLLTGEVMYIETS